MDLADEVKAKKQSQTCIWLFILLLFMYGNALPASHSAHPLSFTALSATTRGIATFLHTVWIHRTKNALWRTAQSRSNSSSLRFRCVCLFMVNVQISILFWNSCLSDKYCVGVLRNSFTSTTTVYLSKANVNGTGSDIKLFFHPFV